MKYALSTAAMLLASPVFGQDWSGNWLGFSLGYGEGSYEQGDFEADQLGVTVDVDRVMGGLHYERNFQRGNRVLGFDVDLSTGVRGITPQGSPAPWWTCELGDCNVDVKTLMTIRGRLGWLLSPETMIYGAGGLAAGEVEGGIYDSLQQGSSTAIGYTIGVGLSHMIQPDAAVYVEINHVDLGTLEFGQGDFADDTLDGKGDFSTVKVGVNFRF